jgi:hypothetical protein
MMGLAIDFGRVYTTRNEVQTFTDSAALSAVTRLNGTSAGISAARSAVTANPNRWYFGSKQFTNVSTEFSANRTTWEANPATAASVRYVRVTAPTNSVAIYFLNAMLPNAARSLNVAATSTAGVQVPSSNSQGVFPFAPLAKNLTGPNFGYVKGNELTLLWPSSVGSNGNVKMNNLCAIDRNQAALDAVQAGTTADRGYIQETSASAIAAAIEDDHMDYTVTLNEAVSRTGGVKSNDVAGALAARIAQDADHTTDDYDTYVANHNATALRRIVVVPIVNNATDAIVLGFAKVFLPSNQPRNPNDAKCAMYIGPADLPTGNSNNGDNSLRLLQ